jgi:hypothetical protein
MTRPLLSFLASAIMATSLSAIGQTASAPLEYTPLATPCRAVDTRLTSSPIQGGTTRTFSPFAGNCNLSVQDGDSIVYAGSTSRLSRAATAHDSGRISFAKVIGAEQRAEKAASSSKRRICCSKKRAFRA